MRRSEMETLLDGLVIDQNAKVHDVLAKMEAAGVVWDPEEEPLPGKLQLADGMVRSFSACHPWIANPRQNYLGQKDTTKPAERVLAEMVRRYNAWPELERLAEEAVKYSGHHIENVARRLAQILESGN